jgi:hypothetical protein
MAIMPGAVWRPLPSGAVSTARMSAFDIICIHTMVGSLAGTDSYFRTGSANSHFGTGGDGTIYQWVDTSIQSWANLNGNHHVISIENADIGPEFPKWNTNSGAEVPAFTGAQIEAIAKVVAWTCKTHNIPCELIPDAKPGRRGIGYHRQGVPGYMVAGAEKWSNATGKVCPGDRRVAQIPQIIARAKQILNPTPLEDDMTPDQAKQLSEMHWQLTTALPLAGRPGADTDNLYGHVLDADAAARQALAEVRALSAKVDALLAKQA